MKNIISGQNTTKQTDILLKQRKALRLELRQKRHALTHEQQVDASTKLTTSLLDLTKAGDVIALYLANDDELSPDSAIAALQKQQRLCLLPVMHSFRKGYLNFQRFTADTKMVNNNFNILEPKLNATETFALTSIDYIFMPLVGFDEFGNRMGMGGGFYDRTLSTILSLKKRPKLIGLAHDCQQVERLPTQAWDVPLDQIITPTKKIIPIR